MAAAFVAIALAHTPEPGVTVREVRLTSPRGERVPTLWITPRDASEQRGTALLAHGITASKETLRPIAEALARAGFTCCVIDLPSHGESETPLTGHAVDDAFAAGAIALAHEAAGLAGPRTEGGAFANGGGERPGADETGSPPSVDVLVGHSFGAGTGARALGREVLAARLFVAMGAKPGAGALKADRVLLVSGRFDELITPDELRQHAAALGRKVQVEIAAHCEHALEPFDPQVAEYVVAAAQALPSQSPRTAGSGVAAPVAEALPKRILGQALLFCLALGGISFLPRTSSRRGAVLAGLCGGGLVVAAAVFGLHGMTLYLAPTGVRLPLAIFDAALALGACATLGKLLARVPQLASHEGPATHGLLVVLALFLTVGVALAGRRFPALIFGLLTLLLGAGAIVGLLVRRRTGSNLAAHAAFALVVGYVPGAWFGGLL